MPNPIRFANIVASKPLNKAEEEFVACMTGGKWYKIGDERPTEARDGEEPNIIRADLIGFFARGGDEDAPMQSNTIFLQGAWIPDAVNLVRVISSCSLVLTECHFADSVVMPHSAFHLLNLSGSLLKGGLVGDNMKIESDILMHGGFASEREMQLHDAQIGGKVICNGGKFKAGGQPYSLDAERIKIGGGLAMCNGFVSDGEVRLCDAVIGGNWYCVNANFQNEGGRAIAADMVQVGGSLLMQNGFVAKGEVRLPGAHISGNLVCNGGVFNNTKGDVLATYRTRAAITAEGIKVDNHLSLRSGFSAKGAVLLHNAEIGGGIFCDGGTFVNENDKAIVLDGAKIRGDLYMQKISAQGEVRLIRTDISGSFGCDGGKFYNKAGDAIVADGIKVGSIWAMRQGFVAEGRVQLLSANINGDMLCHGGHFNNEGGNAFIADQTRIGGTLSMANDFVAKGEVRLYDVDISGNFQCDGATIYGNLNAKGLHIKNSLRWKRVSGNGTVNLNSASASVLDDDVESRERFDFSLDGFSYDRFANPGDVKSRIDWLSRRPKGVDFSLQPFQQAAKVLFEMGWSGDARWVLFEAEKAATKEFEPKNLWRRFLGLITGYYYLPERMFWTSLIIIAFGAGVFWAADKCGYIVPHQPVVLANPEYKKLVKCAKAQTGEVCSATQSPTEVATRLFPDYPRFNFFLFSLDTFLPTSPLHQEAYWYPQLDANTPIGWRLALTLWYVIEIITGWLLVSLITLTYTGILQRRQTGGTGDK